MQSRVAFPKICATDSRRWSRKDSVNHSRPNSAKLKWPLESDDSRGFRRSDRRQSGKAREVRTMTLRRTGAALAAALAICFGANAAAAQGAPRAAPVSQDAQTQELAPPSAAPTANVDVTPTGETFGPALNRMSIVSLFLRADVIVKAVFIL